MKRRTFLTALSAIVLLAGCETFGIALTASGSQASTSAAGSSFSASAIEVGNNATVRLEAGTYRGTLMIDANNATVIGAGAGRTVIDGDVVIDGNSNELRGVSVTGSVRISGNTNTVTGSDLSRARVSADGNNNRY